MMNKHLVIALVVAVFSVMVFWLPFKLQPSNWIGINFANTGMSRIVQNFDGINFLIVAKSWYDPEQISIHYQDVLVGRRPLYFSAHYPGFPVLISAFDQVLTGPNALLLAIIISNVLMAYGLYYLALTMLNDRSKAMWISIIALFFPARMLADRAVGSNEPLFIFFSLMSLASNYKNQHWLSSLWGVLAVLTRSPGILLFAAYAAQFLTHNLQLSKRIKEFYPYLLIPVALILLWAFYGYRFGSFWAYFQVGGNLNIYYPFSVFASGMDWVSGIWNEDLIYLFALILAGGAMFYRKYKSSGSAYFVLFYGLFVMCVAHRDLSRYSLPLMPLIGVAVADYVNNKLVRAIALVLLIPTFMYAWQFVLANYQPIMDWSRYL